MPNRGAGITGPHAAEHRARYHRAVAALVADNPYARASLIARLEREVVCAQLLLAELRRPTPMEDRHRCPALTTT